MSQPRRICTREYLDARHQAFMRGTYDDGTPMDPMVTDFRRDPHMFTMLWIAFMAGSGWERRYVGPRYTDDP